MFKITDLVVPKTRFEPGRVAHNATLLTTMPWCHVTYHSAEIWAAGCLRLDSEIWESFTGWLHWLVWPLSIMMPRSCILKHLENRGGQKSYYHPDSLTLFSWYSFFMCEYMCIKSTTSWVFTDKAYPHIKKQASSVRTPLVHVLVTIYFPLLLHCRMQVLSTMCLDSLFIS